MGGISEDSRVSHWAVCYLEMLIVGGTEKERLEQEQYELGIKS